MSALRIIEQIKSLPLFEREQVAKFTIHNNDFWIPAELKQALGNAQAGRLLDMESAPSETPPPCLR